MSIKQHDFFGNLFNISDKARKNKKLTGKYIFVIEKNKLWW